MKNPLDPSRGGSVRSTLSAPLQRYAAEQLRQTMHELTGRNVRDGAIVVLDNATGEVLAWTDAPALSRVTDTFTMLHTGRGAAVLGLVLGLMALAVPALAVSGFALWLAGWRARPRIRGNASASRRFSSAVRRLGSFGHFIALPCPRTQLSA